MKTNDLIKFLSNIEDPVNDPQLDIILDEIDIDLADIKSKSLSKLHTSSVKKKIKGRKYILAVACAILLCISTVNADNIKSLIESFFNQTPVSHTVVSGDAYQITENLELDSDTIINSMISASDKLELHITSKKRIDESDVKITTNDGNNEITYLRSGYSFNKNKYFMIFMNEDTDIKIKPFKTCVLHIDEKSYDIDLTKATSINKDTKLYIADNTKESIEIAMGALIEKINNKEYLRIVPNLEDTDLKLLSVDPVLDDTLTKETLIKNDSIITVSSSSKLKNHRCNAYLEDKSNKYALNHIKDEPFSTLFKADIPINNNYTLYLPALSVSRNLSIPLSLDVPKVGSDLVIDKKIDFINQSCNLNSINRTSENEYTLDFSLDTNNKTYIISSFSIYMKDNLVSINSTFNKGRAIVKLVTKEPTDILNLEIYNPTFIIEGNWRIDLDK